MRIISLKRGTPALYYCQIGDAKVGYILVSDIKTMVREHATFGHHGPTFRRELVEIDNCLAHSHLFLLTYKEIAALFQIIKHVATHHP